MPRPGPTSTFPTEKLRSLYTSLFYASWHAPVVESAAKRTVYVVTTAAGQSFETMYEDTPFFLSIHGVECGPSLPAVTAEWLFRSRSTGRLDFLRDDFSSSPLCARILVTVCRTWFSIPEAFPLVLWLKTGMGLLILTTGSTTV